MSVIRVVHNRENQFVQLNKKALWDENLSLKAVGLWARCLSRPDDWRFNVKELITKCKEGRRAIDGAINELIEHHYAVRLEHWEKSEDGKFSRGGVEYVFFEFPATQEDKDKVLEEFKKSFRHCCFGDSRNGDSRNAHLLIKKETEKDLDREKENKKEKPPAPKGEVSLLKYGKFVQLSKEDFDTLRDLCGGTNQLSAIIDEINDYLSATGKKPYKDYAAAIRNWHRRKRDKDKGNSWKQNKYPTKSNGYNHTSSDKDTPEPILVPLSSIMDTECCLTRGVKKIPDSSS